MSLLAKAGSFNTGTAAAGNNVQVTGVGFQPKVVLFWWTGSTNNVDEVVGANINYGMGAAKSATERWAVGSFNFDNSTSSNQGGVAQHNNACVARLSSNSALDGLLDFVSMDSDGFTLIVDDQFSASQRIHYLALGGDAISDCDVGTFSPPAATGNQDLTGVGFQPDFMLFCVGRVVGDLNAAPGGTCTLQLGFANANNEACFTVSHIDSGPQDRARHYIQENGTGEISVNVSDSVGNPLPRRDLFVSFISDGVQVNKSDTSQPAYGYVALKGVRSYIGSFSTRTDGNTINVTDPRFTPDALFMVSANVSESVANTITANGNSSIGAATATEQVAMAHKGIEGANPSNVGYAVEHDAVYINIASNDTITGLMEVTGLTSLGFDLSMSNPDPSAAFVPYFALGSFTKTFAGTSSAVSGQASSLGRRRGIGSTINAISGHSAYFGSTVRLAAQIDAISGHLADLSLPGSVDFVGTANAVSGSIAPLSLNYSMAGTAVAVSSHQVLLSVDINLAALANAVSGGSGGLFIDGGPFFDLEFIKPADLEMVAEV